MIDQSILFYVIHVCLNKTPELILIEITLCPINNVLVVSHDVIVKKTLHIYILTWAKYRATASPPPPLLWLKNISDFRKDTMVVDASKYLGEMKASASEDLAPVWARMGECLNPKRQCCRIHIHCIRIRPKKPNPDPSYFITLLGNSTGIALIFFYIYA